MMFSVCFACNLRALLVLTLVVLVLSCARQTTIRRDATFVDKVRHINTDSTEYGPHLLPGDSLLLFVSDRDGSIPREELYDTYKTPYMRYTHDVWVFRRRNDITINIPTEDYLYRFDQLNTDRDEGLVAYDKRTRLLIFTACNRAAGYGDCDLWGTVVSDDARMKPFPLSANVNTEEWESGPTLSSEGRELFFISNVVADTYLGTVASETQPASTAYTQLPNRSPIRRVWHSERDVTMNSWSPARPIVFERSTNRDCMAPLLLNDGVTMIVSITDNSFGRFNYNFYRTRRTGRFDPRGNEIWEDPTVLPAPLNSSGNELGICFTEDYSQAFFSSDRDRSYDIYYALDMPIDLASNMVMEIMSERSPESISGSITVVNRLTGARTEYRVSPERRRARHIFLPEDFIDPLHPDSPSLPAIDVEIVRTSPKGTQAARRATIGNPIHLRKSRKLSEAFDQHIEVFVD